MPENCQQIRFCLNFAIVNAKICKRIDSHLSIHGISFTEFMVLFHLNAAPDSKLKRIDLAERLALSASGITRLIAPMEKIGLIRKEANKRDARVSLVKISAAGRRVLDDTVETFDQVAATILEDIEDSDLNKMLALLKQLGGTI